MIQACPKCVMAGESWHPLVSVDTNLVNCRVHGDMTAEEVLNLNHLRLETNEKTRPAKG